MPKISRLFIKTGLLYFILGLLLRVLIDFFTAFPIPVLTVLFWHALMLGWITQIIMGVSIWMFPGRTREEGFKAQKLSWLTYLFLNAGLLLRMISSPLLELSGLNFWAILLAVSAPFQLVGVLFYVFEMWPRIQSKKQRIRNRKKKG
ncbi:MAG TPA: hypothetical protein VFG39_06790 [Balneolaceae bacterium]|nr:hypothetical protein [Balneolaceae bacterium]